MASLSLEELNIERAGRPLINNANAQFNKREIIAIVGNNGSGKSTLLHCLAGLHKAQGRILIDGNDMSNLSQAQIAKDLTLLFQSTASHPYSLTHSRIAQGLMPHIGYSPWLDDKSTNLIEDIAARFGISHLLARPLAKLSGGELRLVNIAKCLVHPKTSVILLDEPSVFLDFEQKDNLAHILTKRAHSGALVIFSSHDRDFIKKCAHKVLSIHQKAARLVTSLDFIAG